MANYRIQYLRESGMRYPFTGATEIAYHLFDHSNFDKLSLKAKAQEEWKKVLLDRVDQCPRLPVLQISAGWADVEDLSIQHDAFAWMTEMHKKFPHLVDWLHKK